MITWDKQYELGIASIDNQHKELIKIAGELSNILTEALFEQYGFPNSDEHIIEHSKLIEEINEFDFQRVDNDQVGHGKKILNMLITWVFKHISSSDFKYRDYLLDKGVK